MLGQTFPPLDYGEVKMGNCSVGIGDTCIWTIVGHIIVLKNVAHILDLYLNFFSMTALDDEDYKYKFKVCSLRLILTELILN